MEEKVFELAANMSLQEISFNYNVLRQALRNALSRYLADKGGKVECSIPVYEDVGLCDELAEHITGIWEHQDGTLWVQTDSIPTMDFDDLSMEEQINIVEWLRL